VRQGDAGEHACYGGTDDDLINSVLTGGPAGHARAKAWALPTEQAGSTRVRVV